MLKILLPIDFSDSSLNAMAYASQMMKALDASLTMMHVVEPVGGDATMFIDGVMIEEELEAAEDQLNAIKRDFFSAETNNIKTFVATGFPVEKILNAIGEEGFSLVIMGTEGTSNRFQDMLGSNTYSVVKEAKCAVLTVPIDANKADVKRIGFAVTLEGQENAHLLTLVKYIARHYKAEVILMHVIEDEDSSPEDVNTSKAVLWLKQQLQEFNPSFITISSEDVAGAINEYALNNNVDLLVISPHKHDLLSILLKGSTTRKLVLHTQIPVLSLPADF